MIRILIADDHAVVRQGVRDILADAFPHSQVGEAANAVELLEQVRKQTWDAVVLDIGLPGKSGLEALQEIKALRPRLPVIIFSMYPEEQFAVRVLRLGAAGYLTKESAPEQLAGALRKVLAGGRYVSATLAEKLAVDVAGASGRPPHELLSDREFTILRMIGAGRSVKQIADALNLSVKTVSTYRTRVLEKTGLKSNAELVRYALDHKLVE